MLVEVTNFLYVAQAVEGMLAVAYGNKLYWFESDCCHIYLCRQDS